MTDDPFERLRQAQEAFEEYQGLDEATEVDEFLGRHEHVRDLLDPVLDPARDEADGERVIGDDYRIIREIGRGGMGIVYEARQMSLNRRVALKMLAHELSSSPTAIARFRREATLAAGIEHPSIAKVYGFTQDDSGYYLVMELVSGTPLDELLAALRDRRDELSGRDVRSYLESTLAVTSQVEWRAPYEHTVIGLIAQIADALEHAHQAGIIHRDVKPSNILVQADGRATLTDFGLARETGAAGVTLTGEHAGTPAYQSPEQIAAKSRELGPRTDIFSLGATLYEALTFERAFAGESILEVQNHVLRVEPRHPTKLNPRIDRDLAAILHHALEKDPADRYASAAAFAADLRNWVENRAVAARTVSRITRLRQWCERNRLAASFIGVLIASTIVTAALLRWTQRALDQFEWLSEGVRVEELADEYRTAPPAWPENIAAFDSLLEEARELAARLPEAERHVADIRARGRTGADGSLEFDSVEDRFLFEGTSDSLIALERIRDDMIRGLEERRAWALEIEPRSIDEHRAAWDAAIESIRSARGLEITPQIGLVPLRRDPESGFWEFWHMRSGRRPELHDGRWTIEEDTGIVFVLVPPGTFAMGCQSSDPDAPNFDPNARVREQPVHDVTLEEPFFLSKFEMSRGQWARMLHAGEAIAPFDANEHLPIEREDRFPIEDESYDRAVEVLGRYGLTLPTEAQWEYACRAGTTTAWSVGKRADDLSGYANVRDAALKRNTGVVMVRRWPPYASFDDGFPRQAPVDAFRPNAFGLHQMHGNVREFCLDQFFRTYEGVHHRASDGWMTGDFGSPGIIAVRGGYYAGELLKTASGIRFAGPSKDSNKGVGIRPARRVLTR